MGRRVPIIILVGVCVFIIVMQGFGVSWGGLKDPGLSEKEIRRRWKEFEAVKDKSQVKGAYRLRRA